MSTQFTKPRSRVCGFYAETTKALLMMAANSDVGDVRWMMCLSSVVRTGTTIRKGSVKWVVCLSDALLLMSFMLSAANTEEIRNVAVWKGH